MNILTERKLAFLALKCALNLNETVNWAMKSKKAEIKKVLDLEIQRVDKKSREDLKLPINPASE